MPSTIANEEDGAPLEIINDNNAPLGNINNIDIHANDVRSTSNKNIKAAYHT